jgi:predicted phage terminase large subunit-like protein
MSRTTAMTTDRKVADAVYRNDFGAFTYQALGALNGKPLIHGWHIDAICHRMQEMLMGRTRRRLVINAPPRSLKSSISSVALPAWILGHNPAARIICASYSEDLAYKFSRDTRALLETPFYKRVFPRTRLNPKKTTEGEFETTRRGYRLACSIGGTLTGRGGDVLIIDDPIKANDAYSQVALTGANDWFRTTALSRLDDHQNCLILVTMQRLHVDDLSGTLIEQGWPSLAIPAIAQEPADYPIGEKELHHRAAGELLQPDRDTLETLEELKRQLGSHIFAAQYQQNPTPPDGNMIKAAWLRRYHGGHDPSKFRRVVLACDPAGKAGIRNDYTAMCLVGADQQTVHLLNVARGHWTVLEMRDIILACAAQFKPDLVIVEDTSTGMGLIQLLKEYPSINVVGRRPKDDKETRMARQQGRFEAGRILLPYEASWLPELENELLAFPYGRYDDQVDALLLSLEWLSENQYCLTSPVFVGPIIVTTPLRYPYEGP